MIEIVAASWVLVFSTCQNCASTWGPVKTREACWEGAKYINSRAPQISATCFNSYTGQWIVPR